MNIHEYQAKQIFKKYGIKTPNGIPAFSVDEAVEAAKELGGNFWVVKAQIHAGGRGKAGGVKLARSLDEVRELADEILGKTLVTHQTGPEGALVRRLYIESGADIASELYLAAVVDRDSGQIVLMASTEGGVDIEAVAEETPEKIFKVYVNPMIGFADYQGRELAFKLGLEGKTVFRAASIMKKLYTAFVETDADLVEINPLVVTGDGDVIALDGKMNFDDNALFRNPEIEAMRDEHEEDPAELEAKAHGLSYVNLDGNIGCMVNGAGLAMATMDIIKHFGGDPANFLDVGGGATAETVTEAFKIITSDDRVEAIFINIFGGIMRCDVIAEGVIAAVKEVGLEVPLVVRLAGTNDKAGKEILSNSDLNIIAADTMADGAQKVIAAIS
ncbi:ADP-forming succinate--CoA ligase subunit beta [Bradymonas sediminis]|uniref:Succinate--CoA ligase [ADP-forming] subunit beta n=1 Tax=Bradymonas sediminis TaxID=1548548 RepID=A0A2Z4FJP5_9DELT|nr:ADP-forming succinate--CoA ligase subunit beta [Bradymonas sediminis]AWV89169.1 ADP-forming succinate--CoA ligase subunit beta [Bradymonas sediminis]TDP64364.1 succinyl-CoA synthetase beta subunit [Bradymonas sediminis]